MKVRKVSGVFEGIFLSIYFFSTLKIEKKNLKNKLEKVKKEYLAVLAKGLRVMSFFPMYEDTPSGVKMRSSSSIFLMLVSLSI